METQDFVLETFEAAVQQQDKPVTVIFQAPWSVACLMYQEKVDAAAALCGDDALFGYVDIDAFPELTERFSIITIPTTLIFYKEEIVKQYMGIQEPEILQAAVFDILGKPVPQQGEAPTV